MNQAFVPVEFSNVSQRACRLTGSPRIIVSNQHGQITATVYVAGATDDSHFTAEQAELLRSALAAVGADHTVETYPAKHGFAVPDNPTYDPAAEARHWAALERLYRARLPCPPV